MSAYKTRLDTLMISKGSTIPTTYQPYITPTTIPIDLSTILYNGNPLFEENALKGINDVKDSVTPYKAIKKTCETKPNQTIVDSASLNSSYTTTLGVNVYKFNKFSDYKGYGTWTYGAVICDKYEISNYNSSITTPYIFVDASQTEFNIVLPNKTLEEAKTIIADITFCYELATPIEVSINWASTLRGITGYSNGTITLLNTNNMDSANTITYNSIIKENCCAKMVQSRNGSVVKTINLPTVASDGYSAGSVSNVRDFTTNKRIGNVSKENDLGSLNWFYGTIAGGSYYGFRVVVSDLKVISISSQLPNLKCAKYNTITPDQSYRGSQGLSCYINTPYIVISDSNYTDATTFKTAMANDPLYYELADASKTSTDITPLEENVIVVQAGDELAFYDSNDNLVTVPTDLTYRIEVAN